MQIEFTPLADAAARLGRSYQWAHNHLGHLKATRDSFGRWQVPEYRLRELEAQEPNGEAA